MNRSLYILPGAGRIVPHFSGAGRPISGSITSHKILAKKQEGGIMGSEAQAKLSCFVDR
jgi:hypothetical protein